MQLLLSHLVVEVVAAPELCRVEGKLQPGRHRAEAALDQVWEQSLGGGSSMWTAAEQQVAEVRGETGESARGAIRVHVLWQGHALHPERAKLLQLQHGAQSSLERLRRRIHGAVQPHPATENKHEEQF